MPDPFITVKLIRGQKFYSNAYVRKIKNGQLGKFTLIPKNNHKIIEVGKVNTDMIKIDVQMDGGAGCNTIWHFEHSDDTPESVTVTIGDD
jgi:hypothetical protein